MKHDTPCTTQDSRNSEGVWAIILAAGESKRMGLPKMLLQFAGVPMIQRVMDNVMMSEVKSAFVVLGSEREKIKELVEKASLNHCYNEDYKDGMLSSVKCGFRQLPAGTEAVLVFQGDQPYITPGSINSIIAAFRMSDKGIVIPVYNRKRGHPILISKKYFEEVEQLDKSVGLRGLAGRFPGDVLEIASGEPGILRDFDTYADYIDEISKKSL